MSYEWMKIIESMSLDELRVLSHAVFSRMNDILSEEYCENMTYTPTKEVVEQFRRNSLEKIKDDIEQLKAGTFVPDKLKYPPPGKCQVWLEEREE